MSTYDQLSTATLTGALEALDDGSGIVSPAVIDAARDELTRRMNEQETLPGLEL